MVLKSTHLYFRVGGTYKGGSTPGPKRPSKYIPPIGGNGNDASNPLVARPCDLDVLRSRGRYRGQGQCQHNCEDDQCISQVMGVERVWRLTLAETTRLYYLATCIKIIALGEDRRADAPNHSCKAMPPKSAGVLPFRKRQGRIEVLLVHPGGPFWRNKDAGAWSIPKGEYDPGESAESVARREFREELGIELAGPLLPLAEVRQRGGKIVTAFAAAVDLDAETIHSNMFEIEWPPHSGKLKQFPEIDRAEWFAIASAYEKINVAQRALLERLEVICANTDNL